MADPVEEALDLITSKPALQGEENADLRARLIEKAYHQRSLDREFEISVRKQDFAEKTFWQNTPLVVALTGVIAVAANFVADYFRADQDLTGLLTKVEFEAALASTAATEALARDNERELLKAELQDNLANAAAARNERLKEVEFQYSILNQLVDEPNEKTRARLLLFYIKAGALKGLDVEQLSAMAETSIRNTGGDPSDPMGVPSRQAISTAADATTRIQFSGSSGQTGFCTAVIISADYVLAPSFCDNNFLGGSHPFSAALAEGDDFVRLKKVWNDEATALSILQREVEGGEPVSLVWNSIRAPSIGEAIYFVAWDNQTGGKLSRTCSVTGFDTDQFSLTHDCDTGPGVAGALLLAVSDDAPVGVQLGQNSEGGYGASLGSIRDQLAQFF